MGGNYPPLVICFSGCLALGGLWILSDQVTSPTTYKPTSSYTDAIYDQLNLNFNQTKVVLVTENNYLGKIVGTVLSSATSTGYWNQPFQICWTDRNLCQTELGTSTTIKLLPNLLNCQHRLMAFYQDELQEYSKKNLLERCWKPSTLIIRTSKISLLELALLQVDHPYWKLRLVYILRDPRARLADIKANGIYRSSAGYLNQYTNTSFKQVIPTLCSTMLNDVDVLMGEGRGALLSKGLNPLVIKHEDLLLDLEHEMRQLFINTKLIFREETEKLVRKIEFPELFSDKGSESGDSLSEELFKSQKWKISLTRDEILNLERNVMCAKVLKYGGYEFYDFLPDEEEEEL